VKKLTIQKLYVRVNMMRAARLQTALERLTAAISDVEAELAAMKAEHDPLASHIFVSRRNYRNANDTKGDKRREVNARLSFNTACELGFRGSLDEWERLMGAVARR
jgi:septal ring factor EnvC (AmiA/AmiB activator)